MFIHQFGVIRTMNSYKRYMQPKKRHEILVRSTKMKKFTIILMVLIAMPITVKAQKNEIAGTISSIQVLPNSQKCIVINNTKLIVNSGTMVKADLKENIRVLVFYETNPNDSLKIARTIVAEKLFVPVFRFVKPIPKWIWGTAISTTRSPANFKKEYGNIENWGIGVGIEKRAQKGFRVFVDINIYRYKLEIAEKGESVHHYVGTGGIINFPSGAKYYTNTAALRLGFKYVFFRDKKFQPWVGAGYGINAWRLAYLTWDENKSYCTVTGNTWRSSIVAGIDFTLANIGTFTFFFDAISPVASYTLVNPFGVVGTYSTPGDVTFPTPRIGFSFSGF